MEDDFLGNFPTVGDEEIGPDGRKYRYVPINPQASPLDPGLDDRGAVARGLLNLKADAVNFGGLVADTFGYDEQARKLYDSAYQASQESDSIPRAINGVEDVNDLGSAATFVGQSLGESGPFLGALMLAGGVGAGVGAMVGAPVIGAGIGLGSIAAFLTDVGLMTGESVGIARENGEDPKDIRVVGSGVGKAALDFAPIVGISKRLGLRPGAMFSKSFEKGVITDLTSQGYLRMANSYAKRAAGDVATIISQEVPTEVMQEVININLDRSFKEIESAEDWTPNEWSQIKNAAAGAAAFGFIGFGTAAYKGNSSPQTEAGLLDAAGKDDQVIPGEPGINAPAEIPPVPGYVQTGLKPDEMSAVQLQNELARANTLSPANASAQETLDASTQNDVYTISPEGAARNENARLNVLTGEVAQINQQLAQLAPIVNSPIADPVSIQAFQKAQQAIQAKQQEMQALRESQMERIPTNQFPTNLVYQEVGGVGRYVETSSSVQAYKDGETINISDKEPMRRAAGQIEINIPPEQRTQSEAATVAIESSRKATQVMEPDRGVLAKMAKPTGVEKLEEEISAVYADESNYRKDGGLKVAAQKKVDGREKRIDSAYGKAGYKRPVPEAKVPENFAEAQEQAQNAVATDIEPLYKNLSERESALLESLQEKDAVDGLTDNEYGMLERLEAQAEGEIAAEKKPSTKEEANDIMNQLGYLSIDLDALESGGEGYDGKYGVLFEIEDESQIPANIERAIELTLEDIAKLRKKLEALAEADADLNETGISIGDTVWLKDTTRHNRKSKRVAKANRMPIEAVRSTLTKLHSFFGVKLPVNFHTETSALMQKNRELIQLTSQTNGWFDPRDGSVNYVLDGFANEADVVRAFLHETVGHLGMRAMMSFENWRTLVKDVLRTQEATVMSALRDSHVAADVEWKEGRELFTNPKTVIANGIEFTYDQNNMNEQGLPNDVRVERNLGQVRYVQNPQTGEMGYRGGRSNAFFKSYDNAIQAEVNEVKELAVDEYVARTAGLNINQKLMKRVVGFIRTYVRKILNRINQASAGLPRMYQTNLSLDWTMDDFINLVSDSRRFLERPGRNVIHSLEHQQKIMEKMKDGNAQVLRLGREEKSLGGDQVAWDPVKDAHKLTSLWSLKAMTGVLTPLQMAERANVAPVTRYLENVQKWWARKRDIASSPTKIAGEIDKLGKKEYGHLVDSVFAIRDLSEELNRKLNPEELQKIFKEKNLGEAGQAMWKKMDESFNTILTELEAGLEKQAIRNSYGKSVSEGKVSRIYKLWLESKQEGRQGMKAFNELVGKELGGMEVIGRLNAIKRDIDKMRQRNYFPNMRFGKWAATWRDKDGKIIHFSTYLTYAERQRDVASLQKNYPEVTAYLAQVTDKEFSFLAMPPAMFDILQNQLELSPKQKDALREIFYLKSPGRNFLRHLVKKKNTAGFSRELLRVYATYMSNSANHIARVEYHQLMQNELTDLGQFKKESPNGDKLAILHQYYLEHFEYIMNPGNDLAKYRALGFLWYLGFNVKSAAVNLTQVPMVAYPYLAARYGDVKSVGAIAKAYKTITNYKLGGTLDPEHDKALNRAIDEGFVDESQAVSIAGYTEDSTLQKLTTSNVFDQSISRASYYGAFLFQHAEKFNREVTFTAARELHLKQNPQDFEGAFQAGRSAVQSAMFEYAKWNRASFMRGKKSIFFLFWQYMQSLSFLAAGGAGKGTAMRVWGMLLMAAGIQGLPFMENILDILDFGSTKAKEALGMDDPQVQLRDDIRELVSNITDNPDLVMHGLSRSNGMGALHLLELLGIETPDVDISGSLSAGRVIPGIGEALGTEKDPNTKFARTIAEVMGPVLAVPFTFYKALASNDPDQWKTWERAMPVAIASASKSARRYLNEEETFRGGGAVVQFDPKNSEHRAELLAQALGFSTTRLNKKYELRNSQENMRRYWTVRRSLVLESYAYAIMSEDKDSIDRATKAIITFNNVAPAGAGLSGKAVKQSVKQRFARKTLRENGIPNERFFIDEYLAKEKLY